MTVAAIAAARRELDQSRAAKVVRDMRRRGLSLHLSHARPHRVWTLSDGCPVPDVVARVVISDASVVGVGDALFPDRALSQTFRVREAD
jgi:hypothetical protein